MKRSFESFSLDGSVYTATEDGVDYTVWSFVNEGKVNNDPTETEAYLDACADLVWESLLRPLRDLLPKEPPVEAFMSYQRGLETYKLQPGREYAVTLDKKTGLIHFYVDGSRVYVLTVLNPQANFAAIQRFLNSSGLKMPGSPVGAAIVGDPKLTPPSAAAPGAGGIGPGRGENSGGGKGSAPATGAEGTDYNRIFKGSDVTTRARVLSKPEPQYTESARKYAVQGTVVLRAIFSNSGEVTNIRVMRRLPHGLTERAVGAAKLIRFTPALKDEHPVSTYIQLEYNFNLY